MDNTKLRKKSQDNSRPTHFITDERDQLLGRYKLLNPTQEKGGLHAPTATV